MTIMSIVCPIIQVWMYTMIAPTAIAVVIGNEKNWVIGAGLNILVILQNPRHFAGKMCVTDHGAASDHPHSTKSFT